MEVGIDFCGTGTEELTPGTLPPGALSAHAGIVASVYGRIRRNYCSKEKKRKTRK